MITSENLDIDRIIIHRVHKKSDSDEYGSVDYSNNIIHFEEFELETLKKRICTAFSKTKRFFKLEITQFANRSFFSNAISLKHCDTEIFIEKSKDIAYLLALSHNKKTIPSGLLIIMDGYFESKHFVLVIKAELQEAFTIKEQNHQNIVELISDLFLSPSKDFYKIGYIVEDINTEVLYLNQNADYSVYMYDDNFSSGNRNLAEYFYSKFLGFSTNNNDKLLTKNFYADISSFIESSITDFEVKKGLRNALNSLFREDTTGVINPQDFVNTNFPQQLLRKYNLELAGNYTHSFTKDLTLVDKRLKRGKIIINNDLKLEGTTDSLNKVSIKNARSVDLQELQLQIENGEIDKLVITLKTVEDETV